MKLTWGLALGALLLGPPAAAAPQRIVSMNLCTDQMALLLAGPERIASISFLGPDPAESALADMARGIPVNHGLAEEIIAVKPDIVLAGKYTTGFAKAMLARLHYRVLEIDSPNTIEGVRTTFLEVGAALGERDRAVQLLADMDRRLAAVAEKARARPRRTAIIYDANGFTVGRPGLADDIMTIDGLINKAPELGIGAFGQVSLENMLAVHPDLIVHMIYRPGVPSIASAMIDHPALKKAMAGRAPLRIPGNLLTCGTPLVADAAERLSAALDALP